MVDAKLGGRSARIAEDTCRFGRARGGFSRGESRNLQRNFDLRLRRWLWNGRMRNMADLAGAVSFVMPVAIIVGNYLGAQNEDRQDERYGDESKRKSSGHVRRSDPAKHPTPMVSGEQELHHCPVSQSDIPAPAT
jgi:hypothetical protein